MVHNNDKDRMPVLRVRITNDTMRGNGEPGDVDSEAYNQNEIAVGAPRHRRGCHCRGVSRVSCLPPGCFPIDAGVAPCSWLLC